MSIDKEGTDSSESGG